MIARQREDEEPRETGPHPLVQAPPRRDPLLLEVRQADAVLQEQLRASSRAVHLVGDGDAHVARRIGPSGPHAHP